MLSRSPLPALLALTPLAAAGAVDPKALPEYMVKARILRVLLDYVEWPGESGDRPLVVGVLEPSPFGDFLPRALEKSVIRGRPLQLRSVRGISQIPGCDVLFIPENAEDRLESILRALRGKPVLTVADTPGFGQRGVIVNLAVQEERTRLEVNLSMMKSSGVTISPQVLKGATILP